jgi:hypothetical protein
MLARGIQLKNSQQTLQENLRRHISKCIRRNVTIWMWRVLHHATEPKVRDHDWRPLVGSAEEQVLGSEVSMDDIYAVDVLDCDEESAHEVNGNSAGI